MRGTLPSMSIRESLAEVETRVRRSCEMAGRDPSSVVLIAVSKTHPIDAIRVAYDAGHRHFGENRFQEALPKIEALPDDITWHFVGTLQSNKARRIAASFDVIHTFYKTEQVDEADKASHPVDAFIEINIADEPQKSGISAKNLDELRSKLLQSSCVRFRGLMTVGPLMPNAEDMRPYFREMRELARRIGATSISMGMSNDFEVAIQEGSTHVRVGTAIFGSRQR